MDRREKPSHGYRAVHLIAEVANKPVEIQIRTSLQQLWAALSEKASDVLDPAIKYGHGPEIWQGILLKTSKVVASHEGLERLHFRAESAGAEALSALVELRKTITAYLALEPPGPLAREGQQQLIASDKETAAIEVALEQKRKDLVYDRGKIMAVLKLLGTVLEKRKGKGS